MDAIAAHMTGRTGQDPTSPRSPRRRGGTRTGSRRAWTPGLTTTVVHSPGNTIPVPDERGHMNFDETFGSHATAVAVEVDPATGQVEVLDAVMVVDSGVVINPDVVEGQHRGGFAPGPGQRVPRGGRVLRRRPAPVLDAGRLHDPDRAARAWPLRIVHRETPSEVLGGFRGAGEAAITAAPAVLAGAVEDALAPLGVRIISTRLSADAMWRAIQEPRARAGALA